MEKLFSRKGKLWALFEIGRPWNALVFAIMTAIGFSLSGGGSAYAFLASCIAAFLIYLGGSTVNDLFDLEVDRHNMAYRPLHRKDFSVDKALRFSEVTCLAALLISATVNVALLFWNLFFIVAAMAYSVPPLRFVSRGILAQFYLGFTTVVLPMASGVLAATGGRFTLSADAVLLAVSLFMLFSFVLIIKDFKDLEGDAKGGKRTFLLTVGEHSGKKVALTGTLVFFPASVYLMSGFAKNPLFLLLSAIVGATLLWMEWDSKKSNDFHFSAARATFAVFLLGFLLFL